MSKTNPCVRFLSPPRINGVFRTHSRSLLTLASMLVLSAGLLSSFSPYCKSEYLSPPTSTHSVSDQMSIWSISAQCSWPAKALMCARTPSSVTCVVPQSVWCTMQSSSRLGNSVSSVLMSRSAVRILPPALRWTRHSPAPRLKNVSGTQRGSRQVTVVGRGVGGKKS